MCSDVPSGIYVEFVMSVSIVSCLINKFLLPLFVLLYAISVCY